MSRLIFGNKVQGGKDHNEDQYFTYTSINNNIIIGGIFDGHGGYNGLLASKTIKDTIQSYLDKYENELENWSIEKWQQVIKELFSLSHEAIAKTFFNYTLNKVAEYQSQDNNNNLGSSSSETIPKYISSPVMTTYNDLTIVRYANNEPIHGGSTATLSILIKNHQADHNDDDILITGNCGDSCGLLLSPKTPKTPTFITTDHSPDNVDEYNRIQQLDINDKLLFVYDILKIYKKYECPLIFDINGNKISKYVNDPWGNGLHPTNVRYEPACICCNT